MVSCGNTQHGKFTISWESLHFVTQIRLECNYLNCCVVKNEIAMIIESSHEIRVQINRKLVNLYSLLFVFAHRQ